MMNSACMEGEARASLRCAGECCKLNDAGSLSVRESKGVCQVWSGLERVCSSWHANP